MRQLTHTPDLIEAAPAWTRDGSRLAFHGFRNSGSELYSLPMTDPLGRRNRWGRAPAVTSPTPTPPGVRTGASWCSCPTAAATVTSTSSTPMGKTSVS
ncbi:MAG: PD40 domain-containing protein [Anaerolineae bacterium]|nr:MAG: PD40 domain-containing protein [Anaerolineae bacterium]